MDMELSFYYTQEIIKDVESIQVIEIHKETQELKDKIIDDLAKLYKKFEF